MLKYPIPFMHMTPSSEELVQKAMQFYIDLDKVDGVPMFPPVHQIKITREMELPEVQKVACGC